jgi:outer membrane protein assembly factor BamA
LVLKIDGANELETQTIDSLNYTKIHNDFASLKTEVDSVQNTLYKLGYIENERKEIKKINDSSFYSQILLKQKLKTIYIYYKKKDVNTSILKHVSGRVFDDYFEIKFTEVESTLNYINSKITEKGYPFSKLKLSNISFKVSDKILVAELLVESFEEKRSINDIVIKGYEKFPKSYVKHYLKIKPSQIFDLNKIRNKTEQLNNLNFARELKSPEVLFSKDSTTLYLYLEKTQSNTFDGFLGFGTNEETNKLEFDGYLNLNLTNNLNFGESFRLLYKSDENDQKTFETDISLPYLFKSPVGIDLLLRIFKRDSSFTTTNQSAKIHYQINAKHKLYGGIIATESNSLLKENFSAPINDYKTQYLTIGYQFLKLQPNNLLFPVKSKFYFETGFGNRKSSNTKENQSQYSMDAFNIFSLNTRNSIYIRLNASSLVSNTFLENELMRFGGINSIRGFEENSLFSNLYGLINTEYRYQLNNYIYVNSIIDAAYFENKIADIKEKLFSYGFGFGVMTKSGLFKFNYASGKNENSKFKFSNSKIHLSLTTNF